MVQKARTVLSLPTFKLVPGRKTLVRIVSTIGKRVIPARKKQRFTAMVVLPHQRAGTNDRQLVMEPVLAAMFMRNYPAQSYLGKSFEITKHPKPAHRRWYEYTLTEVKR